MDSSGDWCQGASGRALSIAAEKEAGRWIRFGGIPRKPGKKRPKNSISSLALKRGRDKEFQRQSGVLCVTLDRSIPKDSI